MPDNEVPKDVTNDKSWKEFFKKTTTRKTLPQEKKNQLKFIPKMSKKFQPNPENN